MHETSAALTLGLLGAKLAQVLRHQGSLGSALASAKHNVQQLAAEEAEAPPPAAAAGPAAGRGAAEQPAPAPERTPAVGIRQEAPEVSPLIQRGEAGPQGVAGGAWGRGAGASGSHCGPSTAAVGCSNRSSQAAPNQRSPALFCPCPPCSCQA